MRRLPGRVPRVEVPAPAAAARTVPRHGGPGLVPSCVQVVRAGHGSVRRVVLGSWLGERTDQGGRLTRPRRTGPPGPAPNARTGLDNAGLLPRGSAPRPQEEEQVCGTEHETTAQSATPPEPAGTTRRAFLRAGAVAGLGVMASRPGTSAASYGAGALAAGAPVLAGMHVHGSYSEGNASWDLQFANAAASGLDVVWMTDHDYMARARDHMVELSGVFLAGSSGQRLRGSAVVADDGSAHLLAESAGSAPFVQSLTVQEHPNAWNRLRTGIAGLRLTHTFGTCRLDPGATYEFVVTLSRHPTRGGRPAGQYAIRYRFSAGGTSGRSTEQGGLVGVVRAPLPPPGRAVVLEPVADAAALWPDLQALDHSCHLIAMVVTSPRRGDVAVRSVTFARSGHDAAGVLADLRQVRDACSARHGVRGHVSEEMSLGLPVYPHVNTFGVVPRYDLKADLTSTTFTAYYRRRIQELHAEGGIASWNHVFGYSGGTLPAAQQTELRRSTFRRHLADRFLGADLLEVGYASRGGMPFAQHLALWDTFSRHAVFLTGNGVNDDHDGRPWRSLNNAFCTWIWAGPTDEAALVPALRAGRAFTAHSGTWPGSSLDVVADGRVPMGGVAVEVRPRRDVAISVGSLPSDSVVELVVGAVDGQGQDPAVTVAGSFTRSRLGAGGTGTVTIPVDTSRGSCFVRAQGRRGGVLVASGNPLWFLVREPAGGVPASRRVA